MPARKTKPILTQSRETTTEYRVKQTKTGNSSGFRFEGALFKSHPEFNGEVTAYVLAPGRLLVTAEPLKKERADPVMAAFLAFLAQDVAHAPHPIRPLDARLAKRIDRLVKGVHFSPDDELEGEVRL
jgi:hypothetical protein